MKEPKEALPQQNHIYSVQTGQLAADAKDIHIKLNANTRGLYE